MHTDRRGEYLFVVFKQYVEVYDITNLVYIDKIQELGPFDCTQIFVDDYCTYMSVLLSDAKSVQYYVFDWEYKCDKV